VLHLSDPAYILSNFIIYILYKMFIDVVKTRGICWAEHTVSMVAARNDPNF